MSAKILQIVVASAVLSAYCTAAPIIVDSGSVSQTCFYVGGPRPNPPPGELVTAATGTSIDFPGCPTGYRGPGAFGSISGLDGDAGATGAAGTGRATVSMAGSLTDTLIPQGNVGTGTAEFTFTFKYYFLADVNIARASLDLVVNGATVWVPPPCLIVNGCVSRLGGFFNTQSPATAIVDVPIDYGVPFTYSQDVKLFVDSSWADSAAASMTPASVRLLTGGFLVSQLPEADTGLLVSAGALLLLGWKAIAHRGVSVR